MATFSGEKVAILGAGEMSSGIARLLTTDRRRVPGVCEGVNLTQMVARHCKDSATQGDDVAARMAYLRSGETWPAVLDPRGINVRFIITDVASGTGPIEEWDQENIGIIEGTGALETKGAIENFLGRLPKRPEFVIATHVVKDAKPGETIVIGVNEEQYNPKNTVVPNASCTTKGIATVLKPLCDRFGEPVEVAISGEHGLTGSQYLYGEASGAASKRRKKRSAPNAIIPAETNATDGLGQLFPNLYFAPINMVRVDERYVSFAKITLRYPGHRSVTQEQVNDCLQERSQQYPTVLGYAAGEFTSHDFHEETKASTVDANLTRVHHSRLGFTEVNISTWYAHGRGSMAQALSLTDYILTRRG